MTWRRRMRAAREEAAKTLWPWPRPCEFRWCEVPLTSEDIDKAIQRYKESFLRRAYIGWQQFMALQSIERAAAMRVCDQLRRDKEEAPE